MAPAAPPAPGSRLRARQPRGRACRRRDGRGRSRGDGRWRFRLSPRAHAGMRDDRLRSGCRAFERGGPRPPAARQCRRAARQPRPGLQRARGTRPIAPAARATGWPHPARPRGALAGITAEVCRRFAKAGRRWRLVPLSGPSWPAIERLAAVPGLATGFDPEDAIEAGMASHDVPAISSRPRHPLASLSRPRLRAGLPGEGLADRAAARRRQADRLLDARWRSRSGRGQARG